MCMNHTCQRKSERAREKQMTGAKDSGKEQGPQCPLQGPMSRGSHFLLRSSLRHVCPPEQQFQPGASATTRYRLKGTGPASQALLRIKPKPRQRSLWSKKPQRARTRGRQTILTAAVKQFRAVLSEQSRAGKPERMDKPGEGHGEHKSTTTLPLSQRDLTTPCQFTHHSQPPEAGAVLTLTVKRWGLRKF